MKKRFSIVITAMIVAAASPFAMASDIELKSDDNTAVTSKSSMVTEERSATATEDKATVRQMEKMKERAAVKGTEPFAFRFFMTAGSYASHF